MSNFNEGDLVEAVKGETMLRGRLIREAHPSGDCLYLPDMNGQPHVTNLESMGWKVSVIEKATPPLPIKSGLYLDKYDYCWSIEPGGFWLHAGKTRTPEEAAHYAPFTRLEPVPVTAKKVIDAVGDYLDGQLAGRTKDDILRHIADEFGVSNG